MASSSYSNMYPIIPLFAGFLLVSFSALSTSIALQDHDAQLQTNQTFKSGEELQKLNRIRAHLRRINKPSVKTIQSPDGDLIDCVPSHLQPAFDHPKLKGQKPLDPPEVPKGYDELDSLPDGFQVWMNSGESCPEGTLPIRRTTEEDMLRASSIRRFGRELRRPIRRDASNGHEYAVGIVKGGGYYGAKAGINVWSPHVENRNEFSSSQIWVLSGAPSDLNSIEAGLQVYPALYGDSKPRLFTFWTADGYGQTGCYNLHCSGFVQTNKNIVVGGAISPASKFNDAQREVIISIWKERRSGDWWLQFGSRDLVGYWPSSLFNHLDSYASMVEFGGEIMNSQSSGFHTTTQMGSGHVPREGYKRASYFRNVQVQGLDYRLISPSNLQLEVTHPNCYDIQVRQANNNVWGKHFYYGGPGRNVRCP